jgi:hypothetical protein
MNIPTLLEKYGRTNRLVGDYRACLVRADLGTDAYKDCRISLDRAMVRLEKLESALEDMGLLNADDRHTERGAAK